MSTLLGINTVFCEECGAHARVHTSQPCQDCGGHFISLAAPVESRRAPAALTPSASRAVGAGRWWQLLIASLGFIGLLCI
ncbi:hypothetical protein [Kushneria indalinina]|uniref:Uncharacterized protein n=1 Tax=Kushneria indalinina DSM 14324 TaxID=1122140 RepID=A0A3D9DVF4_9GAMM|nr:hypothetical protein [Kushneria indalinina]REC94369.1 hypothetical protein C8D72_2740 [Kushneria indalinina DSM 14324]